MSPETTVPEHGTSDFAPEPDGVKLDSVNSAAGPAGTHRLDRPAARPRR